MLRLRSIQIITLGTVLALLLMAHGLMAGKPGGGGKPSGCDGQPIEVYQEDWCGQNMWIPIQDSAYVCDAICVITGQRKCNFFTFIGGVVVPDETAPNGFRFDPATVRLAAVTEERYNTTVCAIAANPLLYDTGETWWLTANLTQYR